MKTKLILIMILFLVGKSFAQQEYYFFNSKYPQVWVDSSRKNIFKKNNLRTYEEFIIKKGIKRNSSKVILNDSLQIKETFTFNKKGNLKRNCKYEYGIRNKIIHTLKTNKNNQKTYEFTWNNDTINSVEEEVNFRNGKIKNRNISKYNRKNIMEQVHNRRGGEKIKKRWFYEYYDNGSKKKSTVYNSKGKVRHTWSYDCKPEGELVAKHKNTTMICKNDLYDENGYRVETIRSFDDKGRMKKSINKFNIKNIMVESNIYDYKDSLTYRYFFNELNKTYEHSYYYKNPFGDKLISYSKMDKYWNTIEYIWIKNGKKKTNKKSEVNNGGKIITETITHYKKSGDIKKIYFNKNDYNSLGLLINIKCDLNKKGKITTVNSVEYKYY